VTSAEEVNGQLSIKGNAVNSNSYVNTGDQLSITFRGDAAGRSLTNFDKGNGKSWRKEPGKAAGTIVTLESCYLTNEANDGHKVVSARWLNTVRSPGKPDHEDRSTLEGVLALAPRVYFTNPSPGQNEPEKIALPVVGEKFSARVQTAQGTFKREFPASWGVEKLNELSADAKVRVQQDVLEPRDAERVNSKEELLQVLAKQLGRGTEAYTLLRVAEGDEVITRVVRGAYKKDGDSYVPDVEGALKDLFKNNLFAGVKDTDALLNEVSAGHLTMEAIPGYRLSFAGNPSQDDNASYKLVSDLKQGHTQRFEMIFGKDPERFAQVILPGILRNSGASIADFQPINLIGDEHGTYAATQFSTPHIAITAKPKAPSVPLEDASPAERSATPGDVADDFDRGLDNLQSSAEEPELVGPAP
jgi:hypothetical protein